jgi:hypothetical protein
MIKQRVLLTSRYQNECLAFELPSSACPTKKSSLQIVKYSHWPKCGFCRLQLHFLKAQTNWLKQVARGKALIWVQRPQVCNKQSSWGASLRNFTLGRIITVRRAQHGILQTNKQTNNATRPSSLKRLPATLLPKQLSLPKFLKPEVVYIYPDL